MQKRGLILLYSRVKQVKKLEPNVYYYSDIAKDDFGPKPKKLKKITGNYKYNRDNFFVRLFDFVTYRLIMTPLAFIYVRLIRRTKIVNKELLKKAKKEGVIVYANHTHAQSDAYLPNIAFFPCKVSMVVNAANVSVPVLGNMTKAWGAMPLPEDYQSSKNFLKEVGLRLKRKGVLIIYPEATLWPYYTSVRPFGEKAFSYPLKYGAKTYVLTTTYQTNKKGKLKTVAYIDGPFLFKEELSKEENMSYLHNLVFDTMKARSKMSTYEKIKYVEADK